MCAHIFKNGKNPKTQVLKFRQNLFSPCPDNRQLCPYMCFSQSSFVLETLKN